METLGCNVATECEQPRFGAEETVLGIGTIAVTVVFGSTEYYSVHRTAYKEKRHSTRQYAANGTNQG